MEIEDDDTYAVIVSESGETQVFKLECVDNSFDSNQLVMLFDDHVGCESADVISKEFDHKVEEPLVEDHKPRVEIKSAYALREEKKSCTKQEAPDALRIPQGNELQPRFRFIQKLAKPQWRGGDQEIIPEADNHHEETVHVGSRNDKSYFAKIDTKFCWTRAMTRALVDEYRALIVEFRNPEKRQRDVWESLARELRRKGYAGITWDMCDRKWRNLKSTFKTIYYSNRELNSKRKWEFYDEFKILFAPDVRGTRMERKSRTISPRSNSGQDQTVLFGVREDSEHDDLDRGGNFTWTLKKQPWWFSEFLNLYRTEYKSKLELGKKHHDERMEIKNRTCELIERLLDI